MPRRFATFQPEERRALRLACRRWEKLVCRALKKNFDRAGLKSRTGTMARSLMHFRLYPARRSRRILLWPPKGWDGEYADVKRGRSKNFYAALNAQNYGAVFSSAGRAAKAKMKEGRGWWKGLKRAGIKTLRARHFLKIPAAVKMLIMQEGAKIVGAQIPARTVSVGRVSRAALERPVRKREVKHGR